jgi:hypothetical protein
MGANTRAGRIGFGPSHRLVVHPVELVEVAAVLVENPTSLRRLVERPAHPVELALLAREHGQRLRDLALELLPLGE